MENERKFYKNIQEDYRDELVNKTIELDKLYIEKEIEILKSTALDANKLTTIHNLRKSNFALMLRSDLIGNEKMVEIQDNK